MRFWQDSLSELSGGLNPSRPPKPAWVLAIFMSVNLLLTGLQLFWGSKIVSAAIKKFSGDESYKNDD